MKKIIGMLMAALCCICLAFPGAALADAASGGDYNYQWTDFYVVVDAWDGYVNFRYGPGLEYGINCPIYNGNVLHITRTANNYYDEFTWGQTDWNGMNGWVSLHECSVVDNPYAAPQPQPQSVQEDNQKAEGGKIIIDDGKLQSGEWQESFNTVLEMLKKTVTNSYVPYSETRAAAVLIDNEGKAYEGAAFEASGGNLRICAEEAAVAKAISEGNRSYKMIALLGGRIETSEAGLIVPCAECRAILKEFVSPGDFYVLSIVLNDQGGVDQYVVRTLAKIMAENDQ